MAVVHKASDWMAIPVSPNSATTMQPGYAIIGYYTSWSIYARNHPVWMIDPQSLTHLNYAFANLREDGQVILGDPLADTDQVNVGQGDSWDEPAGRTMLHGNFHQLWRLKQRNRGLKTGLSIGGWTWSTHFSRVAATPTGRQRFAQTAVQLLVDLGLDYLDLDWEYPGGGGLAGNSVNAQDAANLVSLLATIRLEYAQRNLTQAQLTAAISCNLTHYDLLGMSQHLDYFLLMTYDFAGGWSSTADHQANLYGRNPTTMLSVHGAIEGMLRAGVQPQQIVMGVPFYGRSFGDTSGLATPFTRLGPGDWEPGILDYRSLPSAGCVPRWESLTNSTFCYGNRTLISYEDPTSLSYKLQYLRQRGLGGIMFWELSGDYPLNDHRSLLRVINAWIGGPWKEKRLNNLCFPHSKYYNIRQLCAKDEPEQEEHHADDSNEGSSTTLTQGIGSTQGTGTISISNPGSSTVSSNDSSMAQSSLSHTTPTVYSVPSTPVTTFTTTTTILPSAHASASISVY